TSPGGSGAPSGVAPPLRALDAGGREYQYRVDEKGRRYVTGADGDRLYVDEQGDCTILRKANGDTAAVIDGHGVTVYDEHGDAQTYVRDPNGNVLVPDPNGD